MLFEIDNIEFSIKGKPLLNGVYLQVETGNITGILGSNGCGKSSLLSIIFGHQKSKYLLIRIDKKPYLKPLYKNHMASYLPQGHLVPNRMKVYQAFQLFRVDFNLFTQRFETFKRLEGSKFKVLSGGERRFLEIYLVLKTKSHLVLLDEPFTHLSPLLISGVKDLIEEEKAHKAIVITDHFYREVVSISDQLYLLKNGSTISIANTTELESYQYIPSKRS